MKQELQHIINLCLTEDRSAQEELYHYTFKNLLKSVMIYSKDYNDSKWLFNMGMLKIYRSLGKFNTGTDYLAWASVIIRRTCIDYFRKNKKYTENLSPVDIEDQINKHIDFDTILNQLDTEIIIRAIQNLPENQRIVFSMFELDDYSHVEIETMIGINSNTSKWLLSKAKKNLKEKLAVYYNIKTTSNE